MIAQVCVCVCMCACVHSAFSTSVFPADNQDFIARVRYLGIQRHDSGYISSDSRRHTYQPVHIGNSLHNTLWCFQIFNAGSKAENVSGFCF